MINSLTESGM